MSSFGLVLGRVDTTPFFLGSLVDAGDLPPHTVGLGGHVYPIDLTKYRYSSQETLRDGSVAAAEPSDSLFNANGAWSRYRYSWHEGADQEVADFRKEASEFRFETSVGIDPWTEGQLTLLPQATSNKTVASANNKMIVSNNILYVSDGTALYYTTDLTTWNTATAPGGTVTDLSTDGTDLFVATTDALNGLVKYASSAPGTRVVFATPVTGPVQLVEFVANRLLISKTNTLYEVASTGVVTSVWAHFQPGFVWTTAFAVGSRIYIGGYSGTRSEVYTLTTTDAGSLVRSQEAVPLPIGELLNAGYAYSGAVLLCSTKGARLATIGADGTLSYGPLVDAPGDVHAAAFEGRFAWTSWTNHPSGSRGTMRLALDQFVSVLQPAYASDIYADAGATGEIVAIARFLDKTIFVEEATRVWWDDTTYVAEGTIDSGMIYFGTVEQKALTELFVAFNPLAADLTVGAYVYDDQAAQLGSVFASEVIARQASVDLDGAQVRSASVRLVLRTSTGAATPTVRHWRLRAYPVPPPVTQWVVPLIIHTNVTVGAGEGQAMSMNVIDEVDAIRGWFETKQIVTYQEGQRAYRVRVDAFELAPNNWTDDGAAFQQILTVRLVSA